MPPRTGLVESPLQKSAILKAKELAPATRAWIASVLHVDLNDDDECTLTVHRAVVAPTPQQRAAARDRLFALLREFDERTKDVTDEEMEAAIEEAMQAVQPRSW